MNKVVIIGGGIAATTCAEYISTLSCENTKVIIVAATDIIKTAHPTRKVTNMVEELFIYESNYKTFENQYSNVTVVCGKVTEIHPNKKFIKLHNFDIIHYDKLCICSGAIPKTLTSFNPHVLYLRDTDSVKYLQERLSEAKKLIVIGNGGIALELVHEIVNCNVTWCVKTNHIGSTFFNEGSSSFLLSVLTNQENEEKNPSKSEQVIFSRSIYEAETEFFKGSLSSCHHTDGSALGPSWSKYKKLSGTLIENKSLKNVTIKYNCEPLRIFSNEGDYTSENVYVELSTSEIIGGDIVICATGVVPNISFNVVNEQLNVNADGCISVDCNMRSNITDIYAAGDVCSPSWEHSAHWFPMKLWTQGWQMGAFAGKCIIENFQGNDAPLDFCFELFTHATTFFGYKVCLLGCYNRQKLDEKNCKLLIRYTANQEYIELVVMNGRIQGATLIGDTDLEETFENLILNQIDISFLGTSILDPSVDIEGYFD